MSSTPSAPGSLHEPVVAGVVTALVGFTSSFAVVLAGLRAVGATGAQAISGLIALTVVFAVGMILLGLRYRIPVTLAWSTPGAALLAGLSSVSGGWPAAVGAFIVVGLLVIATGLIPVLAALIARIPASLAQAMLAGVLLSLCLAPFRSLAAHPLLMAPILLAWLAAMRWLTRWALPLTVVVAVIVIMIDLAATGTSFPTSDLLPALSVTLPQWSLPGVIGIAVPLYIVTMASQNVPGVAVLSSFGYRTPWRAAMTVTGIGTVVAAPFGGHAINLAAISAALAAGPEAGRDRSRRWIAAVTAGGAYLVLALLTGVLVTVVTVAPAGLIEAVAGLALLGTFSAAVVQALSDPSQRIAAAVTFLTAASGITFFGIGGAFWGLAAGLAVRSVLATPSTRSA